MPSTSSDRIELPSTAVIGGTGDLGFALVTRLAERGYPIIIGSRKQEKAEAACQEVEQYLANNNTSDNSSKSSDCLVEGLDNLTAADKAELVVLAVPYGSQFSTLQSIGSALTGKVLVTAVVPLQEGRPGKVKLPALGAAALEAQEQLGDNVNVVAAFQNVAASHLQQTHPVDCDVLVAGDSKAARELTAKLVEAVGMRPFHAGSLANAAAAEALTSVLIRINRDHRCHAGIRITGTE